jgi:hypothetical protein
VGQAGLLSAAAGLLLSLQQLIWPLAALSAQPLLTLALTLIQIQLWTVCSWSSRMSLSAKARLLQLGGRRYQTSQLLMLQASLRQQQTSVKAAKLLPTDLAAATQLAGLRRSRR